MTLTITAPPDYKGAVIARLKAELPGIAAAQTPALTIAAGSIKGNLADVAGGGYAIAVVKSGGVRRFTSIPFGEPRLDVHVYGPTAYEAMRLWRLVDGLFTLGGFTAANCAVYDVSVEAEPIELTEDNWDKVFASVIVRHNRVPRT